MASPPKKLKRQQVSKIKQNIQIVNIKTKQVKDLLQNDCHLFEMQIHPLMVPFLTPMESNSNGLAAYIAPVNHNRINMGLVTSIASNMMNHYLQDNTKDVFQLQDMRPMQGY